MDLVSSAEFFIIIFPLIIEWHDLATGREDIIHVVCRTAA
jgi:hypothetical protein